MKKSSRVISTLLLGATLTTFSTGVFAVESQKVVKEKLAGASRYETNLAVSAKWEKAETVILVQGYAIPDALAATPLAKQKDAPILLTETNKLTKATADEITRLGAKNAIIVGGEGVVSKEVEKDLEAMKLNVTRLGGDSRYETSAAVVKAMGEVSKVAVVNGYGESDALSIAAPAAREGMAIVLAGKEELKGSEDVVKNAKEKYVIGGTGVVSEKLEKEIGAKRLGGENRNETNAAILNNFYNEKEIANLYVAKDGDPETDQLVDALGVGPLAGKEGNPVMLAGSKASAGQIAYLKDKTAKKVTEIGGGINQSTLADIVKALEVKDVTPEPGDKDKAEVTGVEVLNARQIEVKFSQKVDKDTAETVTNYEIKDDDDGSNLIVDKDNAKAEVQEDGKTVVVTLPQEYLPENAEFFNQETIRIKIENVMTENKGEVFEKYENKKIKFFDNTLPELKTIKQVGPADFDLVFSEPVTAQNASTIVSAIRIDDGKYSFKAETRYDNKTLKTNVVRMSTSTDLEEGTHSLTIKENKLYDYAGLKLEAVDTKFEAKKNTEDLKASVYKTSSKTVTVEFNKEVENAETIGKEPNNNVKYYLDYENKDYVAKEAEMKDGKLEIRFDREISTGDHKILVVYGNEKKDKIQDLWENELANKEIAFTIAKDTVAPKATVSYNKDDKKIEIKYSKKVEKTEAEKGSNYILKDEKGNIKSIESTLERKNGNELIYRIDAKNLSGKYTLTIKGDKIHDTSVEKNAVKEETFQLDTLDSKAPSVISVRYGGDKVTNYNKIYVEFSEDMKTEGEGSILDKSLYHLNYEDDKNETINKTLNEIEDAKIEKFGDNSVVITLPDALKNVEKAPIVKIGRVCDANGNFARLDGIEIAQGKNHFEFVTTNNDGIVAKKDSNIEFLNGSYIDDADVLEDKCNINIVDKNKIELYAIGNISSIVKNDIKIKTPNGDKVIVNECAEAKHEVVSVKVKEGQYVEATKLTLKFEDPINFTTNKSKLFFDEKSLTTVIGTDCKEYTLDFSYNDEADKKVVKYEKNSAKIFVDENDVATKVQFMLTTNVTGVNPDTFKVEGYIVKTVNVEGNVVTLNLNKDSNCIDLDGEADIDVDLVNPIFNTNGDKTESMDQFQIEKVVREMNLVGGVNHEDAIEAKDATEATQKVTIEKVPKKGATLKVGNVKLVFGEDKDNFTKVEITKDESGVATNLTVNEIATNVVNEVNKVVDKNVTAVSKDNSITFKTVAKGSEAELDAIIEGIEDTQITKSAMVPGIDATQAKEEVAGANAKRVLELKQVPLNGTKLVINDKINSKITTLVFAPVGTEVSDGEILVATTKDSTVKSVVDDIITELNKISEKVVTAKVDDKNENRNTIIFEAAKVGISGNEITLVLGR